MITISNVSQSLTLGRILSTANAQMQATQLRLATGLRINSGKDDPAGLSIAIRTQAQIRGYESAKSNSQYAQGMVDTVSSSVGMINDKFAEIKDLAIKARGAAGAEEKEIYATQAKQIYDSALGIQTTTMLNFGAPTNVAQAKASTKTFQIGPNADASSKMDVKLFGWVMEANTLGTTDFDFSSDTNIEGLITKCDNVMYGNLMQQQGYLGGVSNILESNTDLIDINVVNLTASYERIMGADIAKETANLTKYEIIAQSAAALLTQSQKFTANIALSLIIGARTY